MPKEDDKEAYLSPPIQRAARLLRHLAEGDSIENMSRTARALGINRTTLLRLLHTLEAERFIESQGNGWRIDLGLIGLAAKAFFSGDLVQTAAPVLTDLAEELGLSAHLGVLDRTEVVYVVRRTPNHNFVSNIRVGSRLPAHAANMGRIILAHMPAERVARLYASVPLKQVTPQTPSNLEELRARLDADLEEGLAWSHGGYEAGISSVAAAVFDASDAPIAALNVSGQSATFGDEDRCRKIGEAALRASHEISERLGWRPTRGGRAASSMALVD